MALAWFRFLFLVPLVVLSLSSSRGFGKTSKRVARKKSSGVKNKVESESLQPQVDRFGLPLDFDEDQIDRRLAAQCVKGSDMNSAPTNVAFSMKTCADAWQEKLEMLHQDPLVLRIKGILTKSECESLITLASKSARAKEMPKNVGTFDQASSQRRTSTTWYCKFVEPEAAPLLARASAILGCDWTRFEEVQLARYLPGERFKWHEDAVPPSLLAEDSSDGGQRLATLLVYLSGSGNTKHGGTTTFRDLQLSISPVQGDAILFFPAVSTDKTNPDASFQAYTPDPRTLHAADPVLSSTHPKWVSQLWLHETAYPPTIFKNDNPRDPAHASLLTKFAAPPPRTHHASSASSRKR